MIAPLLLGWRASATLLLVAAFAPSALCHRALSLANATSDGDRHGVGSFLGVLRGHGESEALATGNESEALAVRQTTAGHKLRVCNAFPHAGLLHLYRGEERLTGEKPMAYKTCREFTPSLHDGDQLEARVDNAIFAGTFVISDLPSAYAVLMLVVHRHSAASTAVSFTSHVFADLLSAQVAVFDTYKGTANAAVHIVRKGADVAAGEALVSSRVLALNPGAYEVALFALDEPTRARIGHENLERRPLVAVGRECYAVMRLGVEDTLDWEALFPDELLVYPVSDERQLSRSGASLGAAPLAVSALLIALVAAQ